MASMALGIGLTNIRRYDFVKPGYFYSSIYSIAMGIERLLKLIVIYEHRINNNNSFPTNAKLKSYGHNIRDLYDHATNSNNALNLNIDSVFYTEDHIYKAIIKFLSDFADTARYYNLDTLTGKNRADFEPLHRWNSEINSVILDRHYRPKQEKIESIRQTARNVEHMFAVRFKGESGDNINSLERFYVAGDAVTTKQKYSMYYIYVLLRFATNILSGLEKVGNYFPFLREHFMIFSIDDKSHILRKKSWNPYAPYKF